MDEYDLEAHTTEPKRCSWKAGLVIGVLILLLCAVASILVLQIYEKQNLSLLLEDLQAITSLVVGEEKNITLFVDISKRLELILSDNKLAFLWQLCDRKTLLCSRCLPGWVEHSSRCFFLSTAQEKWPIARRKCLDMGGDMAVVVNAEDQAFLTNMTFQFAQQHPEVKFLSAWIGLQDMVAEGVFYWITGQKLHPNVTYWSSGEPNNARSNWTTRMRQDCVAIVPPKSIEKQDWLSSWDDIICVAERHYMCETTVFSIT